MVDNIDRTLYRYFSNQLTVMGKRWKRQVHEEVVLSYSTQNKPINDNSVYIQGIIKSIFPSREKGICPELSTTVKREKLGAMSADPWLAFTQSCSQQWTLGAAILSAVDIGIWALRSTRMLT